MLTCRELVQTQASDYIDKQLSFRKRAAIMIHLLMCGDCRLFVTQFRQLGRVIMNRPLARVDELTVKRVSERLHFIHTHPE